MLLDTVDWWLIGKPWHTLGKSEWGKIDLKISHLLFCDKIKYDDPSGIGRIGSAGSSFKSDIRRGRADTVFSPLLFSIISCVSSSWSLNGFNKNKKKIDKMIKINQTRCDNAYNCKSKMNYFPFNVEELKRTTTMMPWKTKGRCCRVLDIQSKISRLIQTNCK